MDDVSARADGVIDLIDGAISDWATSADAVRWTSDPPAAIPPRVDRESFAEATERVPAEAPASHGGWDFPGALRLSEPVTLRPGGHVSIVRQGSETGCVVESSVRGGPEGWTYRLVVAADERGEALGRVGDAPPPSATPGAVSPRVPAYCDDRPRWQSPYGPARGR